jgi:hypothetical protein
MGWFSLGRWNRAHSMNDYWDTGCIGSLDIDVHE